MIKRCLVLLLLFALGCVVTTAPVHAEMRTQDATVSSSDLRDGALDRLQARARGTFWWRTRFGTDVISFVRADAGGDLLPGAPDAAPAAKARQFFAEYGDLFGIQDASAELVELDSSTDAYGNTHLSFGQLFGGVPVFGGELQAHFDGLGNLIAVNGVSVPNIRVAATPSLPAESAGNVAVSAVLAGLETNMSMGDSVGDIAAVAHRLVIFRTGLLEGVEGRAHLAYEVEVANSSISIREFVFVDAHDGKVLEQITGIQGIEREVSEAELDNVVWDEGNGDPEPIPAGWSGGDPAQVTAWNDEIAGALETYNLFASMTNGEWLSYDGEDAIMRTVNNDPTIFCPNANWNGTSTNYCNGVTGDDTVAHEWGHAYTQYTSNLIYQYQSGALNESYSDIWGEVVDFLNNRGTDAPIPLRTEGACSIYGERRRATDDSYRWLSGEDDPAFGGAIRDMWNPLCYGHPDKVSTFRYHCRRSDAGGVHINSGVPNHLFALLVDGGTFNGVTVPGIGLTRASHLHWHAQRFYLTPASDFTAHADALTASCSDLTGEDLYELSTDGAATWGTVSTDAITASTCEAVAAGIRAVELREAPRCRTTPLLDPNAPAACAAGETATSFWLTDWEAGDLGTWTVGTRDVAMPDVFTIDDWSVVNSLPDGRPGSAVFVPDPIDVGDCVENDASGVLYLESEEIAIPAGVSVPRLAFNHWVATELNYDGGNLKISVNGGAWTLVPASAFVFNSYSGALATAPTNTNPLAGEPAFHGTNQGSADGSWGQSQLNLAGLVAPGDVMKLRFEMGVDGCNGVIGWYVDEVNAFSCVATTSAGEPAVEPQEDGQIFLPMLRFN